MHWDVHVVLRVKTPPLQNGDAESLETVICGASLQATVACKHASASQSAKLGG